MRNWKTTFVGAGIAILMAVQPLVDLVDGQEVNWLQVAFAACFALFGYLSKDAGVSGTKL